MTRPRDNTQSALWHVITTYGEKRVACKIYRRNGCRVSHVTVLSGTNLLWLHSLHCEKEKASFALTHTALALCFTLNWKVSVEWSVKAWNKKTNAFIHVPFMYCIISINTCGVSLYSFLPLEIFTVCKWHLLDSCCKGCHSSHNHPWAVQSGRWEGSRSRGCSRSSGNSTVSLWCWLEQSPPCQVSLFKTEAKHQSKTKTMKSHKRGSFLQRILTYLWQVKALKIFLQQKVLAQHEHSDADLLALLGVRAMLFVQAGDPVVAQGTAEVAVTWGARPLAAGIPRALCVAVRNTVEMHVFLLF